MIGWIVIGLSSNRLCRGGTFTFDFVIATSYPHDAPKVKCKTKVSGKPVMCICYDTKATGIPEMLFRCQDAGAEQALLVQVFHPNIDLEGNVCLNILREDWKPVLSINSVIYGLQFLFLVSLSPILA